MSTNVRTAITSDGTTVTFRIVPKDSRGRTVKCVNAKHTKEHAEYPESFVKYHAAWCRDANASLPERGTGRKSGTVEERMAASTIGGTAAAERAAILKA